jgi:hypothetical protein
MKPKKIIKTQKKNITEKKKRLTIIISPTFSE